MTNETAALEAPRKHRQSEPPTRPMPTSGLAKLNQLLVYVGMSAQSWRKGVAAGKYPKPRIAGHRAHLWRWVDVRNFVEGLDSRGRRRAN